MTLTVREQQALLVQSVEALRPLHCSYSEASYDFHDGEPVYSFQHIAAYEEQQRLARIRKSAQQAVRSIERRKGSRARLFANG